MPPRKSRGIAAEVHALCIRGVMERAIDHPRLCLPPPPPRLFFFQRSEKISVDSKPEENQPAYQPVTLQDGNTEVHPPPVQTRGLDCIHRPKGRLPSRPNRSRIKGHSRLCSSRKYVPLQGATVRPKARTTPVRKARSVRGSLPQAAGPASVLLPGRLAPGGRVPGTTVPPAALPTTDSAGPGVYSKLGEVGAYAFTAPDLPRSRHRSTPPAGAAEPGQGEHDHGGRTTPAPPPAGPGQGVAPFLGYLASLVDVLPDCRLHMHPLQLHLLRHYRPSVDSLTCLVPLPPSIRLLLMR